MGQILDPAILALAAEDETAWEGFSDEQVILQRRCTCDRGLVYPKGQPCQFCGACGGSGYLTRTVPAP